MNSDSLIIIVVAGYAIATSLALSYVWGFASESIKILHRRVGQLEEQFKKQ